MLLGLGGEEQVVVERLVDGLVRQTRPVFGPNSSKPSTVRGSVSPTIWFSTERNSMSAIGAMKVMSTKISSGAISISARSLLRR